MATLETNSSFKELKADRINRKLSRKEELRQIEVAKQIKSIKPSKKRSS